MKIKLSTFCVISLLFTSCSDRKNASIERETNTDAKVLLTTELPPPLFVGTPAPVILPHQ